jgi:hypothetical protein
VSTLAGRPEARNPSFGPYQLSCHLSNQRGRFLPVMTAGAWTSLLGVGVGAVIALIVASLHRKQMRQIELHRADPIVPLVPPLHPITRFLKTYWYLSYFLASSGYDLAVLLRDLRETTPVTRHVVFLIAFDMSGIVLNIIFLYMIFIFRMASRTIGVLEKMAEKIVQIEGRGE